MRRALLGLGLLAACSGKPPLLDQPAKPADPWAAGQKGSGSNDDKGFDLQGTLAKIKESVEKPGFYEAPEQSADYAAAKPHWGVLKLHGDLVERESWSITGGKGTELRQIVDRLCVFLLVLFLLCVF